MTDADVPDESQLMIDDVGLLPDPDPDAPAPPDNAAEPKRSQGATEPGPEPRKTTRARKGSGARKPSGRSKAKTENTTDVAGKTPRAPKVSSKGNRLSLARDLEQLFGMLGAMVSTIDAYDGAVIIAQAPTTARRLDDIAKDNPAVHRTLAMLTQGSGGAMGVAFAFLPIVLPILAHHELTPESPAIDAMVSGMIPPDVQAMDSRTPRKPRKPATGKAKPADAGKAPPHGEPVI